jgi:hypothetical protein
MLRKPASKPLEVSVVEFRDRADGIAGRRERRTCVPLSAQGSTVEPPPFRAAATGDGGEAREDEREVRSQLRIGASLP